MQQAKRWRGSGEKSSVPRLDTERPVTLLSMLSVAKRLTIKTLLDA